MSDDARGKKCPKCGEPCVGLASQFVRLCVGCGGEWPWTLRNDQQPLNGSHRANRGTSR